MKTHEFGSEICFLLAERFVHHKPVPKWFTTVGADGHILNSREYCFPNINLTNTNTAKLKKLSIFFFRLLYDLLMFWCKENDNVRQWFWWKQYFRLYSEVTTKSIKAYYTDRIHNIKLRRALVVSLCPIVQIGSGRSDCFDGCHWKSILKECVG